jgi:aminopeptidase N
VPVTQVAHDFTLQAGIPLIRAGETAKGVRLTQSRFATDDSGKSDASWQVPVIVKSAHGEWRGLVGRPADVAVRGVAIVNAGQAGYFRTLYDRRLTAKLAARFRKLAPADQLGLINDSLALGTSGYQPMTAWLALARQARPGMALQVLTRLADQIDTLNELYRGLHGADAYRRWGRRVLAPLFAKIGWTAKPGEDQNRALLRSKLLHALSALGDTKVIADARTRFAAFRKNPQSLTADGRDSVLDIVARHADAAMWDQLHALAKTASSPLEQRQYYRLLGLARDDRLAEKTLALVLGDDAPATLRPELLTSVAGDVRTPLPGAAPELAFDFALAHADAINAMLEPDSRNEFIPRLAGVCYDPAVVGKLNAYAAAHIAPSAMRPAIVAEAQIRYWIELRTKRLPEIDRWLKRHKR